MTKEIFLWFLGKLYKNLINNKVLLIIICPAFHIRKAPTECLVRVSALLTSSLFL